MNEAWIRGELKTLRVEELSDYVVGLCDECGTAEELRERVCATLQAATEDSVDAFVDALEKQWKIAHTEGSVDGEWSGVFVLLLFSFS